MEDNDRIKNKLPVSRKYLQTMHPKRTCIEKYMNNSQKSVVEVSTSIKNGENKWTQHTESIKKQSWSCGQILTNTGVSRITSRFPVEEQVLPPIQISIALLDKRLLLLLLVFQFGKERAAIYFTSIIVHYHVPRSLELLSQNNLNFSG